MQRLEIILTDHHKNSARELAKIIADDWPSHIVHWYNGGSLTTFDAEHVRNCTECQAELRLDNSVE